MRQVWFIAATLSVSMLAVAQQQPTVINAQFHTASAGAGLSATVNTLQHSSGPLWLGYEVAAVPGSHFSMCSDDTESSDNGCCGVYRLEDSNNSFHSSNRDQTTETSIAVLVRIDHEAVDEVRFIGTGCRLDAGGLPFTWLTDVKADDSVVWLSTMVTADNKRHTDQALAAIAMHATPKATAALESFSSSTNPLWLREKA